MEQELNKTANIRQERADQIIRDLGEALGQALDIIGEGIWVWEPSGKRLFFSHGFYTMLGFEPFEFPGSFENWSGLLHPDDKDLVIKQFTEKLNEETEQFEMEYRLRSKFGLYRWIITKAKVIARDDRGFPLKVVGSNTDITERKRAIKALRDSEHRYRNLYEKSPLIYQALDKDGYIIDVNSAWIEAMGFSPREIIARWFGDFLVFRYRDQFKNEYASIRTEGEKRGFRLELQRKDKSRLFVELDIKVAYDNQENFLQSHCIIRDITEHKKIEESLRKLTERLRNEHKDLTEKNIALRQVLKHIERDRKDYRHRLSISIDESIMPLLDKLREKLGDKFQNDIDEIMDNLEGILQKDINVFRENFAQLTPRESEMCYLIRDGLTSKEISSELNLSVVTIHKHREQIRKKLDLANKRINLNTYLKSRMTEDIFSDFFNNEK